MEGIRIFLFVGLIVHKLVWEVLKRRSQKAHSTQKSAPNFMVSIIKIGKMSVLGFLLIQTLFLELLPISHNPSGIKTIGLCLYFAGLVTAILGRLKLGDNWVDLEEYQVMPDQDLVRQGIYRYVRHPIYGGDLLLILGLQLALNSWLVLMVVPLFVIVFRQTLAEEEVLARAFPHYREYCRRTKRFVPFLL